MPLINESAIQKSFATLPVAWFQPGDIVLGAGLRTGRLLILKKGAVAVTKEGIDIAKVSEPGAVFGELSILLEQPHTADVRALEASQFHVADEALLAKDPRALFSSPRCWRRASTTPIGQSLNLSANLMIESRTA